MGKRTGLTDFGEIADQRINKMLDFSKINSKEDYVEAVKDLLTTKQAVGDTYFRGENLLPYVDELYKQSKAEERILITQKKELEKKMPAVQRRYWRGQEQQRVLLLNAGIRENIWTIRTKYSGLIFVTRYRSVKTGRFVKKPSFVK